MSDILNTMLTEARAAMDNAYAPYSHFHVGACLRSDDDTLFRGCNVENASYGLTQCAEGSAITAMVSGGKKIIKDILVIGPGDKLITPCGSCRQKIREFSTKDTLVHLCDDTGIKQTRKLSDLIPDSFGPEFL